MLRIVVEVRPRLPVYTLPVGGDWSRGLSKFLLESIQLGDSVRVTETFFFSSMSSFQNYKLVGLHPGIGHVCNEGMVTIFTGEIYLLP